MIEPLYDTDVKTLRIDGHDIEYPFVFHVHWKGLEAFQDIADDLDTFHITTYPPPAYVATVTVKVKRETDAKTYKHIFLTLFAAARTTWYRYAPSICP